ncbi:MAG TPA: hypothetical protein VFW12_05255 [Candidatus Limnocylindria bacterium]|nr:hypothetical protein [Candidatus Limnocylindria bacterium]
MSALAARAGNGLARLATAEENAGGNEWRPWYRTGAFAAIAVVALIPIQAAVFIAWPTPTGAGAVFALFDESAFAGLLAFDLLLMGSWILSVLMFLGLYAAMRRERAALITVALLTELVAVAIYFSSNTAFSLLGLSQQHAAATTQEERSLLLSAGQAMLALYTGTGFNVSYVLSGVGALLAGLAMLRSSVFGRVTAYVGIAYAAMQLLPPTAGAPGMAASLASLLPMVVWLILIARALLRMPASDAPPSGRVG